MEIPKYELGWYYLLGNIHINGIVRLGWVDAKMSSYSDKEDSNDIMKKGMINIPSNEDMICWFLVFRPQGYDFNEQAHRHRKSVDYDLRDSFDFYKMLYAVLSNEESESLYDRTIILTAMNVENKLKW